jgi:hypothetical protein
MLFRKGANLVLLALINLDRQVQFKGLVRHFLFCAFLQRISSFIVELKVEISVYGSV